METINFQKKFNKIINKIKALYRIDSDLLEIVDNLNHMKHQECRHFSDYHKICILYRKCFDSNNARSFGLDSKKYENFDIHQKLMDLANKHVAHSEFDEYDKVHLAFIIDCNSEKAIDIKVNINYFEPFSCLDYSKILKLSQMIRCDIYSKLKELQVILIQEYNQSI